jgi:hypothetical protein
MVHHASQGLATTLFNGERQVGSMLPSGESAGWRSFRETADRHRAVKAGAVATGRLAEELLGRRLLNVDFADF